MPGRVVISSNGSATPGPQVTSMEDRPVPAIRRNTLGVLGSQNKTPPFLVGRENGNSHNRELITHLSNGTDTISQYGLGERRHYPATDFATSYRSPGHPSIPKPTYRPQSAMALTSSSSFNQMKTPFPERPPSSLGVSWGPSHTMSAVHHSLESRLKSSEHNSATRHQTNLQTNGHLHYDGSDSVLPVHQRSHSYGDDVMLGEGNHNIGYRGDRSEDVYAVVTKRQDRGKTADTITGNAPPQPYDRRQLTQVTDKHPSMPRYPHSLHNVELNKVQNLGQDNLAFVSEEQPNMLGEIISRPASTSLDLRNAWQRLYGNHPDLASSNRRPSVDDVISLRKIPVAEDPVRHHNARQQNGHQPCSHFAHQDPHEPVHNVAVPIISPGGGSSHNRGSTPHNLSSSDIRYGSSSAHNQLITVRESPTGQSSSNPDQTSGSNNSSQLSSNSVSNKSMSTFKPEKKSDRSLDPAIGPASKYPEMHMGSKTSLQTFMQSNSQKIGLFSNNKRTGSKQNLSSPNFMSKPASSRRQNSSTSDAAEFNIKENLARPPSRFISAFLDSDDSVEDEYSLKPLDSIFVYHDEGCQNGCATPQMNSQSPKVTTRRSGNSTPVGLSPRFSSKNSTSVPPSESLPKTPDLLRPSSVTKSNARSSNSQPGGTTVRQAEKKLRSAVSIPIKEDLRSHGRQDGTKARSRSLDDVRESEHDSVLSFDVDNTILTVEPSDQSEMGTVRSYKGGHTVKAQLNRLEGMYTHVMKTLEETTYGTRARRRWSIGSSDTSSMRHHAHQGRHSRTSAHRLGSRNVKAIDKRFQRLESHVITLARSVAHLSSELRAQNSLSREIENVKREMQELKSQSAAPPATPGNFVRGNRLLTEFEKYQGWVPSLTNPRRVNKLTKFFGQEPPLLEIFLKQLGYEKFLKSFEEEHIGMIELPYMTEERLQSIGIPMGPRLRILQEAQLYFKQGNFDVYFV